MNARFSLVSASLADLKSQGIIFCINEDDKTGRLYKLTDLGVYERVSESKFWIANDGVSGDLTPIDFKAWRQRIEQFLLEIHPHWKKITKSCHTLIQTIIYLKIIYP